MSDSKFIITGKFGTVELKKSFDGFWEDSKGTVYAYKDGITADSRDRCGVAPLALPEWPCFEEINASCAPHDFAYSSPVYQAFHTRAEADTYLQRLLDISGHPMLADIFSEIARVLGAPFWEGRNLKTSG